MGKHFILGVLILVISGIPAMAESGRGRLPDGRAFRTDEQGMELVDYLAELEVTVEEQKRRIHGLLYEVEEKEDVIEALKRHGGQTPEIVEKDLLAHKTAQEVLATPLKKRSPSCPAQKECAPCVDTTAACNARVQTAENQVQALARQNQKLQTELAAQQSLVTHYQAQAASEFSDERHADTLQSALATEKAQSKKMLSSLGALRAELEAVREKQEAYQEQIAALKTESEGETTRIALTNTKLSSENASLQERIATLETRLAAAKEEVKGLEKEAVAPVDSTRASLSPYALERIRTERGALKTLYNRTRGMVAERDKRYALHRQASNSAVRVRLSNLRSKRGVSMNEISSRINTARTAEELSHLRRDLLDIKQIIKADIQLLGRIANQ